MPSPLTVLITCRELVHFAGSQTYTRDVAEVLRALGHAPVVYSPRLGEVADDLRRRGVAVVDDLDRLGAPPDVIHGQHQFEAMAAMLRFPRAPAVFVCHGWLPWQEAPPSFPSLLRYVAVDALRRDRLVLEHGVAPGAVEVLPNFVDVERLAPRRTLPERPRRALLFSNEAPERGGWTEAVAAACAAVGVALDVVGLRSGRPAAAPESLLGGYDLVFARGRGALEAMAVGAAVVLCGVEGMGPMVTSDGFAALRDANFGLLALRPPVEAAALRREIERYDPADVVRLRDRVRDEHDRRSGVRRLVELYREVIAAVDRGGWSADHSERCLRDAARFCAAVLPRVEDAGAAQRAAASEERLEALQRTALMRWRGRLLRVRPLVAAYRRLKGLPES
ncbi:MAG: glycosyltransferase [Acidobacteriota bacterium]